jgi:hypothetical protein
MNASEHSPQYRPDLSLKRKNTGYTRAPLELVHGGQEPTDEIDPYGKAALQMAWDKLYRARALLEAEQAHMRDDRLALRAEIEALGEREQAVAAREAQIRRHEMELALARADAEEAKVSESALTRLTRAPFDMARSVFSNKK